MTVSELTADHPSPVNPYVHAPVKQRYGAHLCERSRFMFLEFFDFYRKPTLVTDLFTDTIRSLLYDAEFMLVFLILPLLPYSLPRSTPELLEAILELLVLFLFLLVHAPLPFSIESFRGPPFLPRELFNLIPEEEHHVRECRLMRICFQEVWHDLLISQFSCHPSVSWVYGDKQSRVLTISQEVILLALCLRQETVSLGLLVFAPVAYQTAKHLLEGLVNVHSVAFLTAGIKLRIQVYS